MPVIEETVPVVEGNSESFETSPPVWNSERSGLSPSQEPCAIKLGFGLVLANRSG